MLEELELPDIAELICKPEAAGGGKPWQKALEEATQKTASKEFHEAMRNMTSLHWIRHILSEKDSSKPPKLFWPASRYSGARRQATVTKIKLLTGHSWLADGVARRHAAKSSICPLCKDGNETLNHFLYECKKLLEERREAEERSKTILQREITAERYIIEAKKEETDLIHLLYRARVRKELDIISPTM